MLNRAKQGNIVRLCNCCEDIFERIRSLVSGPGVCFEPSYHTKSGKTKNRGKLALNGRFSAFLVFSAYFAN